MILVVVERNYVAFTQEKDRVLFDSKSNSFWIRLFGLALFDLWKASFIQTGNYTIHDPHLCPGGGGEGGTPIWTYERGGDARKEFWIKPLKETNLGVAQPFLTPKRDHFKLWLNESSKWNELKIHNPKRDLYG